MSQRADFERFTMPGAPQIAVEIVPAASHMQRVVVFAPLGAVNIADSAAKAAGGVGYPLITTATPFYLGPHQGLYAAPLRLGAGTIISVFIAPTEDDYLESGLIWHDPEEAFHGA